MGFSMQMFIATGFTFLAAALGKAFGWKLVDAHDDDQPWLGRIGGRRDNRR